jgi:precorrin-6A/cobalt-precorrin-6A reductase
MEVVRARGPYTVDGELDLMRRHSVDVVVTKDSGGGMTSAKLTAARLLGLPVVMVDRPPPPDAPAVATIDEALAWLTE